MQGVEVVVVVVVVVAEGVAGTGNRPDRTLRLSVRLSYSSSFFLRCMIIIPPPSGRPLRPYTFTYHPEPSQLAHFRFLPPFFPGVPLPPRPLSAKACPSSRTCSNNFVFEGNSSEQTLQACYSPDCISIDNMYRLWISLRLTLPVPLLAACSCSSFFRRSFARRLSFFDI